MKKYILNVENRKTLVQRIGELAGEKPIYTGMPKCAYVLRGMTVEKDGTLTSEDGQEEEIIRILIGEGLILGSAAVQEPEGPEADPGPQEEDVREAEEDVLQEDNSGEESTPQPDHEDREHDGAGSRPEEGTAGEPSSQTGTDSLTISLPLDGHTGGTLRNLVNLVFSRGSLLSKATGGCFRTDGRLAEALNSDPVPDTAEEFCNYLAGLAAANGEIHGIRLEAGQIRFTGFPMTEDADRLAAFQQLACRMNQQALTQKRIQAKEIETESEKYTFRNWLIRIGMGGAEFKTSRNILLKDLSGHTAFRNKAEEEKWKARQKAKRAEAKAAGHIAGSTGEARQEPSAQKAVDNRSTE